MRDIKFRVYDEGKIKYPEEYKENRFDNYFIDLNGQLSYYQNCYDGGFFDTENAKIMQFTGLHDKNGKEIYEGDILPFRMYDGQIENYYIVFRNGEYEAINKQDNNYIWRSAWKESEVIGNIYENSDLLKGADNIE